MSSSLTAVPRAQQVPPLVSVLSDLVDPRRRRGRRYPLTALVAAGIAATLSGARSFAAIAQWLADQDSAVAAALGFDARRRAPEESVFRRLFARLDTEILDALMLSGKVGAHPSFGGVLNSIVLDIPPPDDEAAARLYEPAVAAAILDVVVEAWMPDWATWTSPRCATSKVPQRGSRSSGG